MGSGVRAATPGHHPHTGHGHCTHSGGGSGRDGPNFLPSRWNSSDCYLYIQTNVLTTAFYF